ncbi:dedicator of cytokinesis protein 1 isoform X2 [Phymastichus coffea]|uniref:dedicator of cytokinesis protein 1 isoform X2 n=1 Tax=Phymastichus coffea TaxID=108790 RepID=UPI00273C1280|nr:dedicator of cytokinesis protein 1 isoform X2 [Phymastichus coffea]
MMTTWRRVKEHRMGVAIYNFLEEGEFRLLLNVGDALIVLQRSGNMESLMNEITSVLREWGYYWKQLYVSHSDNFAKIHQQILELTNYRSKILSGTLTIDELKDMKKLATAKIDIGNQLLELDMVVRDEHGNILNPDLTSTVQLYYQHETAAERIRKATTETKKKSVKPQAPVYSYIFFVNIKNFVCKMVEDVELLLTLYDSKEMKAITENYVFSWSKQGLMPDIDQLHNLKVLFTDLGSRDLSREKVYLICYAIRVGGMEAKEVDHRRSSVVQNSQKPKGQDSMRRPFGIAAMDVTVFINGKLESDSETEYCIPFIHCEKESLDGTLRRILAQKDVNLPKNNSVGNPVGQGLWCSLKLLRGDVKQVRDENPHLVLGNVSIARKMGFPEVILPGDVRNDLYLTLVSGEFSKGSKSTDKNVEVTVKVCNDDGVAIPGVITLGGGALCIDDYRSVIYYHEDKPRWCETFKIAVPIEEFKLAHLKFTFKHRSSNEAKDKAEKPFAMSYVKLMQKNGTTLQDTQHELLVYKIDNKKYDDYDSNYLRLPSTKEELNELGLEKKPSLGPLSLSSKDNFLIATNVCSTKLTQNVKLLGLLNWSSSKTDLKESLTALMKVDGEEVVKFLQDVLDALFSILMSNTDSDDYDDMVFECLLHIISLVSDRKYQHFQPVLDLYISESFSATLAYKKLIAVLKKRIDSASASDGRDLEKDILLKTMKNLQYCMRFIVESRLLFTELDQDEEEFSQTLTELLRSIVDLMKYETDGTLLVQGACLKYLPSTIPHLLKVYSGKQLSMILIDLLVTLPSGRLTKQKMMTVNDIVHSPLFLNMECRQILLPRITILVRDLLEAKEEGLSGTPGKSVAKVARLLGENRHRLNQHRGYSEEVELCVKILSDVLDLTFRRDVGSTASDIKEIMLTALRTIIQTVISMDRENPLVGNLVSVMLSIFRQMNQQHYEIYIQHFGTQFDLLDFIMEILMVFKDLVSRSVFSNDWCEMIMLQNSVILKALCFFSTTIRELFNASFEQQAWSNFFHCAIAFLTQPALQLESFTQAKRKRIVEQYKDMRRETAVEIHKMWISLGARKRLFVPALVGAILEMALIPDTELRKNAAIPIFFDMMQTEFYSSKYVEGFSDKKAHGNTKANFNQFENEMIAKLDILVEGGKGDEDFRDLWVKEMTPLCENHTSMKEQGLRFVKIVAELMDHLLQYRDVIHTESQEHRMLCTVNLLEFYSEINRNEMYIRYVNKLCELHLECDNYTEAAYTLQLHSRLLKWSDESLSPLLKSSRYPHCQTHRELKECLYNDMIDYFDKGKMWESAVAVCKELSAQYEEETYEYLQLSVLLRRMAKFYDSIVKQLRPEPEYFRVAYYGRGHPSFLRNKVFVYRGKEYERLSDFCSRTLNQLPNAEQMNKLSLPSDKVMESNVQYVQINKVDPVMDEKKHRLSGKPITAEPVLRYHRVNNVQKFRFSRPAPRKEFMSNGEKESGNEFASLWLERTVLSISHTLPGILRWFPVVFSDTYLVSPLRNAIETMEATNAALRDLIIAHRADINLPLNPLSMKLNGVLDPAVMGGIDNYEKAFLNAEYREAHPEDVRDLEKLENLIAEQIPLLGVGVQLHKARASLELAPFHQHLEQCYATMRVQVEARYGKRTCDLQIEMASSSVTMRRHVPKGDNQRLSETSIASNDCGTRSRVTSLTRSQVAALKSLATFNFNSGSYISGFPSVGLTRNNASTRSHILSTTSLQKALGNSNTGTNKKKDSKRRSSRKSDSANNSKAEQPTSQWYTMPEPIQIQSSPLISASTPSLVASPVFELRQELTPKRPLRSEAEKERRLSNRWSGQSQSYLRSLSNGLDTHSLGKGNRDSIGTTDSTASEDDPPPPLPIKTREVDYCNLPDDSSINYCSVNSLASITRTAIYRPKSKLPIPIDSFDGHGKPPTPPPKPKRPIHSLSKTALISPSDSESSNQDSSTA